MLKKLMSSSITTLVASVLAIGLIGYGGIRTGFDNARFIERRSFSWSISNLSPPFLRVSRSHSRFPAKFVLLINCL